jgi:hypothetical protein
MPGKSVDQALKDRNRCHRRATTYGPRDLQFSQNLAKVKRNRTTSRTFGTYVLGAYGRQCRIVNAYGRKRSDAEGVPT